MRLAAGRLKSLWPLPFIVKTVEATMFQEAFPILTAGDVARPLGHSRGDG